MKISLKHIFFITAFILTVFTGTALAASDTATLPVNLGVAGITNILYFVAFIGGALMILTPCSAATIPAYFANSFGQSASGSKYKITQRTAVFFLGFAVVYAFMGGGASLIGRWLNLYQEQLAIVSGVLLIIFALLMFFGMGFFSFSMASKAKKDKTTKGTFSFGMLFAVGFSGCAGPVLAGILTVASSLPTTQAVLLMFFYSLGMGVPLLLLSLAFDKYKVFDSRFFRWNKKFNLFGKQIYLTLPNLLSAVLLLAMGIVFIAFRSTSALSAQFPRAITDIGYGLQDWLLAINLPPYIDSLIFIVVGFVLIKFLTRVLSAYEYKKLRVNVSFGKAKFFLVIALVVLTLFNQMLFFSKRAEAQEKIALAAEASRPAELEVTMLTNSLCEDCFNITSAVNFIKLQNVKILRETSVDWNSEEGRRIIEEYKIEKVPSLLIKGELDKDAKIKALLSSAGTIENNVFVMRSVPLPYTDVQTGEVLGRFSVIFLNDENCSECYDVARHKPILRNFGLNISEEETIDVSSAEGRKLISKYDIVSVPSILLRGDLKEYSTLQKVWPTVGTIEDDGTYVFRDGVPLMGTYKNLETGKVVQKKTVDTNAEST